MQYRLFYPVLIFVLVLWAIPLICAQSEDLVLEWEQHWDTYGVGGTCCYGTSNFFVGDVDNDEIEELITGGFSYTQENGTRASFEAPLRIWNWNGKNLTCEHSQNWNGSIITLYAGDIDNDGLTEIITGGRSADTSGVVSQINIWSYDGANTIQKDSYEGISASSIFVAELDKDQHPFILAAGRTVQENKSFAQLSIFQWNKNGLSLLDTQKWCSSKEAYAYSVVADDLNKDGEVEIITGGYDGDLTNSSGQLRIWKWTGTQLVLEKNMEWQMVPNIYGVTNSGLPMGNTVVNNVKVGDVDSDSIPEIITGGWTYDGQVFNAQLRIWNWNGNKLELENSQEWISEDITEIKSVSLNDVDRDNDVEILTSGLTAVYGSFNNTECTPDHSQLRIWNWKDNVMTLELSKDWTIGDGVVAWNLVTSDIDQDETVEIVTVGCMGASGLCDPDLRIWSIESPENPVDTIQSLILVTIAIFAVIGFVVYLAKRK